MQQIRAIRARKKRDKKPGEEMDNRLASSTLRETENEAQHKRRTCSQLGKTAGEVKDDRLAPSALGNAESEALKRARALTSGKTAGEEMENRLAPSAHEKQKAKYWKTDSRIGRSERQKAK